MLRPFTVACLLLVATLHYSLDCLPHANAGPIFLDLADIVGGGDGTGTGGTQGFDGIDPRNGNVVTSQTGGLSGFTTNTFSLSSNPFVDGVFVPDGGAGGTANIQVSSAGHTVTGIADGDGRTWDYIWHGSNFQTPGAPGPAAPPRIGMHANKGITFDLAAIEAAQGGALEALFFNTIARLNGGGGGDGVAFYIVIDGDIKTSTTLFAGNSSQILSAAINPNDRYLTLITSSNGAFFGDQSVFDQPELTLNTVPEPSSLALFGIGAIGLFGYGWRRKRKQAVA